MEWYRERKWLNGFDASVYYSTFSFVHSYKMLQNKRRHQNTKDIRRACRRMCVSIRARYLAVNVPCECICETEKKREKDRKGKRRRHTLKARTNEQANTLQFMYFKCASAEASFYQWINPTDSPDVNESILFNAFCCCSLTHCCSRATNNKPNAGTTETNIYNDSWLDLFLLFLFVQKTIQSNWYQLDSETIRSCVLVV